MKLIDAAKRVLKTRENQVWVDVPTLWADLTGDWPSFNTPDSNNPITAYWLHREISTDTAVGMVAYFLHDELVAISNQNYRKSDLVFHWVSAEHALKTKRELEKFLCNSIDQITLLDPEQEVDEYVHLLYGNNPTSKNALLSDQVVEVIGANYSTYSVVDSVQVKYPNGQVETHPINDVKFRLMIEE